MSGLAIEFTNGKDKQPWAKSGIELVENGSIIPKPRLISLSAIILHPS
jgi:hypothetical protein